VYDDATFRVGVVPVVYEAVRYDVDPPTARFPLKFTAQLLPDPVAVNEYELKLTPLNRSDAEVEPTENEKREAALLSKEKEPEPEYTCEPKVSW
jgi:hypothetical protein